ncbi:MAG: hypothetical protein H6607_09555 [Flavobacteriales bacterium]|nr:hypothetical protein [Flavobacteriales bacterium]
MKKLCLGLLAFSLFFSAHSCKNRGSKKDDSAKPVVSYGSFGGFTGAENRIDIFKNGDIYRNSSLSGKSELAGTIKKGEVKNVLKEAKKLNFDTLSINQPGNMSYFIKIGENKVVWGKNGANPPEQVSSINTMLQTILDNINTSENNE